MDSITTYIVDSFTDQPFKGNPAGVCILDTAISEDKMLLIAKELGLSETTYITQLDEPNAYSIRYFSPVMEIPLCGHATLAASKVLFEQHTNLNEIHFNTIQNIDLHVTKVNDAIQMVFPIYETSPAEYPDRMLSALGIDAVTNCEYNQETNILILEIEDSVVLENLKPNYGELVHTHNSINGVLVTAPSKRDNFDFESRYFWPWSGTNEDPVTGGTHTFLTKYWSTRLGNTKMNSFQCSARSGFMTVELINENQFTITSKAQIVLEGKMRV